MGLILAVAVQSASMKDSDGAVGVIIKLLENWKNVVKLFADGGYRGKLIEKVKKCFKIDIDIIKRDELHTFKVLLKDGLSKELFHELMPTEEIPKTIKGQKKPCHLKNFFANCHQTQGHQKFVTRSLSPKVCHQKFVNFFLSPKKS